MAALGVRSARHVANVLLACALLCAPIARAQQPADVGPVQTRILGNGLTVVTIEDDDVAVVQTAVWIRFGAANEPPGKRGLAHALARMLFAGTRALSSTGFNEVAARLAARASVTTSNDYTRYDLAVPADKLELALRIDADRFEHASLTEAAWKAESRALRAERERAFEQPFARLYRDVCAAASASALCATAALGESDDAASISAADLRATYRDRFVPANATLVIAGSLRPDAALALAQAAFGSIAPAATPPPPAVLLPFAQNAHVEAGAPAPYDALDIAYAAPGTNDPRAGAFSVLDAVLNDGRSEVSRTLIDSGYAASFATRWDRNVDGGLYHVFINVAHNHASATVLAAWLAATARTRDRGISPDLVLAAKASLVRREEDAGDSLDGISGHVGYAIAVENVAGPGVDAERIDAAGAADVAAAARVYLGVPAATGALTATASGDEDASLPPETITDDFSRRPPAGSAVEPPWVRRALATPEALRSRVYPERFELPNGLRVFVQPVHANPTVFISGTVETSARFEPRGREGIGAMLDALLAAGGAKYDAAARRGVAGALGARFEFGFTFRGHGRAADVRALLDVLADALATPAFAADDVEAVRDDLRARYREPTLDELADRALRRPLLRRGDPALREPSDGSLRAISLEDLRAYARRYVRPDLTSIAIAGDVDPASVRADVAETFGAWSASGRTPDVRPPPFARNRAAKAVVGVLRERVDARFAAAGAARGSRDEVPLVLLRELLASRRYPPNTVTFTADRFRGLVELRLRASPGRLAGAVAALRRELAALGRPAGPAELVRAKSRAVAAPLMAEQATEVIVERVREIGVDRLPLGTERDRPGRIAAARANDVARVARAYLRPSALIEVDEGTYR